MISNEPDVESKTIEVIEVFFTISLLLSVLYFGRCHVRPRSEMSQKLFRKGHFTISLNRMVEISNSRKILHKMIKCTIGKVISIVFFVRLFSISFETNHIL